MRKPIALQALIHLDVWSHKENKMHIPREKFRVPLTAMLAAAVLVSGCGTMDRMMEKMGMGGSGQGPSAELTGAQEVPPLSTKASGRSTITVADDKTVNGTVIVSDMTPTAAHIHQGAPGANGPVIIPLTKTSDTAFRVPASTKLTDAQYAAYKDGNLYVNVHSAAHPGGEVRVQMKP